MAVYYKPQSPIQSGEDFIYPITTADQVKVDKDTRLNAVGVYLKNIDNSTDTTVYGNNATTLGGVAASDYALKTDTAPDSSKLGGKAPEYYIQPRNLLDNSDFSNPINQRGISGDYQYFSNAYTIDRWKLDNRTGGQAGIKLSENGVVISNSSNYSEFMQYVIADTGKQYTLAVGTGDGVKILSGVPSANPESQFLKMKLSTQGYVKCYIIIPSSEITLHWAALYEGSYTADTLPPYVPKGYAAELAECRWTYIPFVNNAFLGYAITDSDGINFQGFIPISKMRVSSPAIQGTLAAWDGNSAHTIGSINTLIWQGNGFRLNGSLSVATTSKSILAIYAAENGAFVADL